MKKIFIVFLSLMFIGTLNAMSVSADSYGIDSAHSSLGFAVSHLGAGKTRGEFNDYKGTVDFNSEDYGAFNADLTIQASSIDTKNEKRDTHLKSADFFNVENFPAISFKSSRLEKRGEGAVIIGDLVMKGISKTLTIPVQINGPIQSPFGSTVVGIVGYTVINRQDFDIKWNKDLDNGGVLVGNEVDLNIELELIKQ